MLLSLSRTKGLLLAGALTLAGLVPHLAFAQAGSQTRPDATNVQMVSVPETYCRSIDNADMMGQDYYFSAADVTAKSGKVIQSHNGGNCCTAAAPWNGTACQAVPTCANDKDLVGWSCVATSDSCARVGMSLINGACGVAAPTIPSGTPCGSVKAFTKGGSTVYAGGYTMVRAVVKPSDPPYMAIGGKIYIPEMSAACNGSPIYSAAISPYLIACPSGYSNYKMTALPGNYLSHLGAVNYFTFQCIKD